MLNLATKFSPESRQPFQLASCSGFRHAEFWLDAELLLQWEAVVELAHRTDFRYALHFPNRGELEVEHLTAAVQMYQELNCSAMVMHVPMLKFRQQLLDFDPDLRLAVENHRLDRDEFKRWADENEYLTLDVEHLWKYTLGDGAVDELLSTLENFLAEYEEKLAHVHLPGYVPGYEEHRPMYCSREMVYGVFSMLAERRYGGLVVSEVHPRFQTEEDLRMDVLLFEGWSRLQSDSEIAADTRTDRPNAGAESGQAVPVICPELGEDVMNEEACLP